MGFLPLLELTSGRASTFFSITSTMPILQLLSFDGLPSNGGVPSLCLPASLHRYFFTSFSLAPGAENHLPVFWPSRQYRGAGRSCTLKGSQPEVRLGTNSPRGCQAIGMRWEICSGSFSSWTL